MSDKNFVFINVFWSIIYYHAKIKRKLNIIFYFVTNKQIEKQNQIWNIIFVFSLTLNKRNELINFYWSSDTKWEMIKSCIINKVTKWNYILDNRLCQVDCIYLSFDNICFAFKLFVKLVFVIFVIVKKKYSHHCDYL